MEFLAQEVGSFFQPVVTYLFVHICPPLPCLSLDGVLAIWICLIVKLVLTAALATEIECKEIIKVRNSESLQCLKCFLSSGHEEKGSAQNR